MPGECVHAHMDIYLVAAQSHVVNTSRPKEREICPLAGVHQGKIYCAYEPLTMATIGMLVSMPSIYSKSQTSTSHSQALTARPVIYIIRLFLAQSTIRKLLLIQHQNAFVLYRDSVLRLPRICGRSKHP